MKQKVQKRGRKLVDFDGARRSYYTLKNSKKIEENKLSKVSEAVGHTSICDLNMALYTLCSVNKSIFIL